MVFDGIKFIKPDIEFDKDCLSYAPRFRKKFFVGDAKNAKLYVCGLGIGYFYINGKRVSDDLFTAPFSDYRKTLWYNEYDVSELISEGENVIVAECGNGWYNEGAKNRWRFEQAEWRDVPKIIAVLEIDGKKVIETDDSWKYSLEAPTYYNQFRVGEYYDSRIDDTAWKQIEYEDDNWGLAVVCDNMNDAVLRKCECEPIREFEEYEPVEIRCIGKDTYIFDFGLNMSGYVRVCINQDAGDEIMLEYGERLIEDEIDYAGMREFWEGSKFQTDRFICSGKEAVWTPKFSYKGFRYVKVTGLKNAEKKNLTAVFVHQAIKRRGYFECSNEDLNRLFEMGIRSTFSNMFYMPTDCPTREKLGWMNDARSSTEQFLTDFEIENVLAKWLVDIFDAMKPNGALPGIVPTPNWGYHWGMGPVSDGALFEIPYRIYRHTGNDKPLRDALEYFERYLMHLLERRAESESGELDFGLDDWAAPDTEDKVNSAFVNALLSVNFLKITIFAKKHFGMDASEYEKRLEKEKSDIIIKYINEDGSCTINKQTAVAMLIYYDIYTNFDALKNQLSELVIEKNFHHDCGMCGLRHLYIALNKCGLHDYAYKIITAKGFPSYSVWLEDGATTLYEMWDVVASKNHHMYSDFMSWMMKTIIGINQAEDSVAFAKVNISPIFFEELDYAKGSSDTVNGKVEVEWKRENGKVYLKVMIPDGMEAYYRGTKLCAGINEFCE